MVALTTRGREGAIWRRYTWVFGKEMLHLNASVGRDARLAKADKIGKTQNIIMAIDVEVNLRIPKVKAPSLDENGYPIDNSTVRFAKMIKVESIPKPGDSLQLTISSGRVFEATVARSDWSEDRSVFIVSCRYANRSMKDDEYTALVNDSDWKMRPLL